MLIDFLITAVIIIAFFLGAFYILGRSLINYYFYKKNSDN